VSELFDTDIDEELNRVYRGQAADRNRRVARLLHRAIGRIDEWRQQTNARLENGTERLEELQRRVEAVEGRPLVTATVVGSVSALPESASPTSWFRVAGDPAVYVGNGQGQPLRKLQTVAL
jgi:hypothetical protein